MKITRRIKREAKRLFSLCRIEGQLDENRVRQVVQQLAAAGKRDCPAMLAQFARLVKLEESRRTARIESAAPLSSELQTEIQANLARRYGPGLKTIFAQQPGLIGGVRIQVGCDVYDGSIRSELAALERSF